MHLLPNKLAIQSQSFRSAAKFSQTPIVCGQFGFDRGREFVRKGFRRMSMVKFKWAFWVLLFESGTIEIRLELGFLEAGNVESRKNASFEHKFLYSFFG